ncbi:MAG: mechanosensitive ion channel domain-containing protein [Pseudomonadota bacterium]
MQDRIVQVWNEFSANAMSWATDPRSWPEFALLIAALVVALLIARYLRSFLVTRLSTKDDEIGILADAKRLVMIIVPLILPVTAYLCLAIGEEITRSIFDSSAVIGFGKRAVFAFAAYVLVRDIIKALLLKFLGKYFLLPVMALYVLGLDQTVFQFLEDTNVTIGNIGFSLLQVFNGIVFGTLLFWLGGWSNSQSSRLIERQEDMNIPTKQLATKAAEFAIYFTLFLLLMSILGIPLSGLAVLSGAIGVGLGFGLQKIAANYVSGIILLLEAQATVGDFVELDGGESGTIHKMTARAVILLTYDGKLIVVPNEDFITTRIVNWSDAGSGNRYEANFSVSYKTDINKVPPLIEAAVSKAPFVLQDPEAPDCELRGFGDSGIDFAVEFWAEGIDDGKNKYESDVLFIIWNALKDAGIEIPYPHRVVEIKGGDIPST